LFTTRLVTLLESGCGLIVATTGVDGAPRAARGWGVDILDVDAGTLQVLIGSTDEVTLANLVERGHIGVTGSNVLTLESAQVKGRVVSIEPVTTDDRERAARHCDEFFAAVAVVDDIPRHLMERLVPRDFVSCVVLADAVFDQTPGPRAGDLLARRSG
jgi:hypothetical protein